MEKKEIIKISDEIRKGNYKVLEKEKISEKDLLEIANTLKDTDGFEVDSLFDLVLNNEIGENCDWNIGSIVQHFDYSDVINALNNVKPNRRGYLYDSIGLCWALGECPYKSEDIIKFLYEVINDGRNPESWWKAAFALEKLTGKNAINNLKRSLKNSRIPSLEESLEDLTNKKNVISILLNSNSKDIKERIYPKLKSRLGETENDKELVNVVWLLGRLKLYDKETLNKVAEILDTTDNYEVKYYVLDSMLENPNPIYTDLFKKYISYDDHLLKSLSIVGLGETGSVSDVQVLEKLLAEENNPSTVAKITQAIYKLKNHYFNQSNSYEKKYMVNENGLIGDDSDKWYADASIYNMFSEAEDPENICFSLIFNRVLARKLQVVNPVDLATGTGRAAKYILNNVDYKGTLYAIDYSQQQLDYFARTIDRRKYYVQDIELIQSKIQDLHLPEKSSFIISSFGFPSKISDSERCKAELENVFDLLTDDGVFVTLGWDETFNDDLNNMWYKYIPDNIKASSFEEWRRVREKSIETPRNCDLSWYKTNIRVPLLYDTLEESINVMGHLFGRDAALQVLRDRRTMWWMSLGITWDDKESLAKILKK